MDLWDYVGTMASIHILARAAPATEESVTHDGTESIAVGTESINTLRVRLGAK